MLARLILKNFLLYFSQGTVSEVHAILDPEGPHPLVRAHSIREGATFVKCVKNWSMTSVLKAACWK